MKEKKPGIFKEFLAFINKGNALALAVGVIVGGAFTAIVTSVNKQILSPIIGHWFGDQDLSNSFIQELDVHYEEVLNEAGEVIINAETGLPEVVKVVDNAIYWGAFLQAVIDFLITAAILFIIVKVVTAVINSAKRAKEKLEESKKAEEPVVEEVPAEPVVVEDPADIKLLTEIRDLLKENSKKA